MTAIIFGISGQDGFYLTEILKQEGIKVIGVSRSKGDWLRGDVADRGQVDELVRINRPEYIYHFAANSTTRHDAVFENHASIDTGAINILEACYRHSKRTRIFLSGSAVQFKNNGNPINETTAFAPISPYAVSRIASVYAGRYYRSLGLQVYVGYFFNHDSPLRTERHINQKIISAVKRIAAGNNEIIEIGNISTKKEFNFAGDSVAAIWKLVNQDTHFEAVIGSGLAYSIRDWVEICFGLIQVDFEKHIRARNDFVAEYQTLVSDPHLIKSLGWQPLINIKGLAELMYHSQPVS